jgi:hypothetical protein
MKKYQVICMSFDGDIKTEKPTFNSINEAWGHAVSIKLKKCLQWYFHPFCFVIDKKSIADAPVPLVNMGTKESIFKFMINKRVKTVQKMFLKASKIPEAEGMGIDEFSVLVYRMFGK